MAKARKPQPQKKGNLVRNIIFWVIIIGLGIGIFALTRQQGGLKQVSFSDVIAQANKGEVQEITIQGNELLITKKDQQKPTERSYKEPGSSIFEQGLNHNTTKVTVNQVSNTGDNIWNLAMVIVPVILIVAFFMFMMRQAQGQNNQAMGFGKSKAKLYGLDKKKVLFSDIAGNENAKQDLEEVVDFLKHPKKYEALGAKIPKGVLLVGSPGTGKTMMARAVAGEAGVPFFSISGSEFVEMFVGVGASRVRDLFAKARSMLLAVSVVAVWAVATMSVSKH